MRNLINRVRTRRVAAWAGGETGDTMIEVVIAILIVGLLAAATFAGFSSVADLNAQQRHEAQANQLAQQDENRMRGLSPIELAASYTGSCSSSTTAWLLYGNQCHTTLIGGTTYTIQSSTSYVAQNGGAAACTQGGNATTADFIATQSEVTWTAGQNGNNNGVTPVIEHSLISPPGGGSIIAYAGNGSTSNSGVAGVQFNVVGPSPSTNTGTLTTDQNGCAVFGGLDAGNYTVSMADSRYMTENGVSSQYPTLTAGGTLEDQFIVAQPGAASAAFNTYQNGTLLTGVPWDMFSLSAGAVSPQPGPFGTTGSYAATVNSTNTVYPATYNAWAGTCTSDDPNGSTGSSGSTIATGTSGSYVDPSATVASGATGNVTVIVPTMLLKLGESYAGGTIAYGNYGDSSLAYVGSWSHVYNNQDAGGDEDDASAAGATATLTFTGTGVAWIGPKESGFGEATVYINTPPTAAPGINEGPVDAYRSSTAYQQTLYSITGLSNTTHTIEIYVKGQNDGNGGRGSGNTVGIDEFLVTVPATSANLTSTTLPYQVDTYDSCTPPVSRLYPSAPTAITASGSTVYPVIAPYGTSVQVCFQNTASGTQTNTGALPSSTTQIANTNLKGTTITSLTLPLASGATGASALFSNSGPCP